MKVHFLHSFYCGCQRWCVQAPVLSSDYLRSQSNCGPHCGSAGSKSTSCVQVLYKNISVLHVFVFHLTQPSGLIESIWFALKTISLKKICLFNQASFCPWKDFYWLWQIFNRDFLIGWERVMDVLNTLDWKILLKFFWNVSMKQNVTQHDLCQVLSTSGPFY